MGAICLCKQTADETSGNVQWGVTSLKPHHRGDEKLINFVYCSSLYKLFFFLENIIFCF